MGYTIENAKELVSLARRAIESEFDKSIDVSIPDTDQKCDFVLSPKNLNEFKSFCDKKEYRQARGVFVTLNSYPSKRLRGCIGYPYPDMAIGEALVKAARSAAFSDSRFKTLTKEELEKTVIEISILTMPQICKNASEVVVGKDGLICEYVGYSGLLLPQVAVEHRLDRIGFIECLCNKAGLPNDAWQKKEFRLFTFQAQVFSEKTPRGEVEEFYC